MRILELLIQKDEEAVKNIGDPAEFMGVFDIEVSYIGKYLHVDTLMAL